MGGKMNNIENLLQQKVKDIDIYPEAFKNLKSFVEQLKQICGENYEIYPQGSMSIGTVIKSNENEELYDIDLVAYNKKYENYSNTKPENIRIELRNNLKIENNIDEKKPCFNIKVGKNLSIDLTPAVNDSSKNNLEYGDTSIKITRKENNSIYWKDSNPKGYSKWFKDINQEVYDIASKEQKDSFLTKGLQDDEIKYFIRTNLQKAIQILKYLRDRYFYNHPDKDYQPISIIITTIVAQICREAYKINKSLTIYEIIVYFIYVCNNFENTKSINFSKEELGVLNPIRELLNKDNKWYLPNPTDGGENFMDRWNKNEHDRKKYEKVFFEWIEYLNGIFETEEILKNIIFPEKIKELNIVKPYGY